MGKRFFSMIMSIVLSLTAVLTVSVIDVNAASAVTNIGGKKYEFDGEKSNYEISDSKKFDVIDEKNKDEGKLTLNGNLTGIVDMNSISAFNVDDRSVSFTYEFGKIAKETANDKWHVVKDNAKEINGNKYSPAIGLGAIVVETSQDGKNWVESSYSSDLLKKGDRADTFYKTTNVQLVGGTYYRITVAYEIGRKIGEKKILFITTDEYEYRKIAEVYEFYLVDMGSSAKITDSTVTMSLGAKTRTEKNDGYYGSNAIDHKDPHFGWDLGHFFVSGYTEDTEDKNGVPVFLKNVGDQVTLWFNLEQDINKLDGNENLTINEDATGYDRDFEIKKTDFGRGALLIRKTDYQNVTGKAEIYTNYLEANATTNANTVVGLFEEGDYEVSLDYEIKNTPRKVAGIDVIPEYSDYTIRFKFSIRNSNCMVFPFDISTGAELIDNAITPNGFKLDLARSRYLTVNVQKSAVSKGNSGYVLDVRFNRAAKDGETYEDEGVYVFTVANQYTGEKTTKTVYVGESPIIKALATSGMSLSEINKILNEGDKIDKNGKVSKNN